MKTYMMRRELKRQPFRGTRKENMANGRILIRNKDFVFEPMVAVETDYDLDSWVELGYLVDITPSKKFMVVIEEPVVEEPIEEVDEEPKEEVDEESVVEMKDDVVEEPIEDKSDEIVFYREVEDGFECIICGKVLRREGSMQNHITKSH